MDDKELIVYAPFKITVAEAKAEKQSCTLRKKNSLYFL